MIKVYCGTFDGVNTEFVATTSRKKAAELFGTTLYQVNQYATITGNKRDVAVATASPGVVFSYPNNHPEKLTRKQSTS